MSEQKLFKSVLLTLITYGCVSLFQYGTFLVPLPAFEIVVLGISIYFGVKEFSQNKITSILFILYGCFQFLGREYNYAFFLSDESLQEFTYTPVVDLFYILSAISLGTLAYFQLYFLKSKWISVLLSAFLVFCTLFYIQILFVFPVLVLLFIFNKKQQIFAKHHSLWLFLLIFSLARELSLILL